MIQELHEGFMSNQELASWAGLSVETIRKNKKKWCANRLSKYAIFTEVRGGVNITQIIEPIYSKKPKDQVKKLTKQCWGTKGFKVDTQVNVAQKVIKKITPPDLLSYNTVRTYVGIAKREMYGVAKKRPGTDGTCKWVYCKIDDNGQAIPFTEQENQIRIELINKYVKTDADKLIDIKGAQKDFQNGDLTIDEYNEIVSEVIDRDCGWAKFQFEFEKAINAQCDFRTMIIDFEEPSAFDLVPMSNKAFDF